MPKITVTIGNFEGTGKTLKAATAHAHRQAHEALEGNYTPEVYEWRQHVVLLWREPGTGWVYKHIAGPKDAFPQGPVARYISGRTYEDARRGAITHLFQNGWDWADGAQKLTPGFAGLVNLVGHLTKYDLDDLYNWQIFQIRYRFAETTLKYESNDCHSYALKNPARADLWSGKPNPPQE